MSLCSFPDGSTCVLSPDSQGLVPQTRSADQIHSLTRDLIQADQSAH